MNPLMNWLAALGAMTRQSLADWGYGARLFVK